MQNQLRVWSIFFAVLASSAVQALDIQTFLKGIEGQYTIVSAGGHAPKPDNALAEVFVDKDEAVLTMPYCSEDGGFCDPGYQFLTYSETSVAQKTQTDGSIETTITVDGSAGKKTYVWIAREKDALFQNPQYAAEGKVRTLEHVLVKN